MGQLHKFGLAISNPNQGVTSGELLKDIGTATFSTTDSQFTYLTSLSVITGGNVNLMGTTSRATDATAFDTVSIPSGAVSGGSIVLTRSSSSNSGGKYSVELTGYRFDTNGAGA